MSWDTVGTAIVDMFAQYRSFEVQGPETIEVQQQLCSWERTVDLIMQVLQQWTSCASRGPTNCKSKDRGVVGTEVVIGQSISSESEASGTRESLRQWKSCYNCHQIACKEDTRLPAGNDYGRNKEDDWQPKSHLASPRNWASDKCMNCYGECWMSTALQIYLDACPPRGGQSQANI